LSAKQRKKFLPLCPEFLIELRSETDRLTELQRKMVEWMKNGAKLAWLIDPQNRQVHIYRAGKRMQTLNSPDKISAEPVLPGFELDLREIWEDKS
jgi:Uma2 family endonuclease